MAETQVPAIAVGPIETPALWQIALWAEGAEAAAARLAGLLGARPPPPGASVLAGGLRLMRIEPLVWWALGAASDPAPGLTAQEGATLDLSAARAAIRIEGARAADLLARFTAADLRGRSFADGAVASTGIARSPVTILRRDAGGPGFDVFVSRSYAGSIRSMLLDHAAQFA